jgi:citrate lyase subunit beta/citryl-CoA lyase
MPSTPTAPAARAARIRSLLFVPASNPHMLEKARGTEADALIIDLEDAVAPDALTAARGNVVHAVGLGTGDGPLLFVRPNHPSTGLTADDLDAAVRPGLFGLVIPKVEAAAELEHVDRLVSALEASRGMESGTVVVLPLVESGRGIHDTLAIGRSPRCVGIAFSGGEEGDYMADIDAVWTPDGLAMAYARGKVVNDTHAAGLAWPVDGVFMNISDPDALGVEARRARVMGFQAKMAIHPGQLAIINAAFTPTAAEVADSRRIIEAYDRAVAEGQGAVKVDGRMVDKANAVRARKILDRAGEN